MTSASGLNWLSCQLVKHRSIVHFDLSRMPPRRRWPLPGSSEEMRLAHAITEEVERAYYRYQTERREKGKGSKGGEEGKGSKGGEKGGEKGKGSKGEPGARTSTGARSSGARTSDEIPMDAADDRSRQARRERRDHLIGGDFHSESDNTTLAGSSDEEAWASLASIASARSPSAHAEAVWKTKPGQGWRS